MRLDGAVAVVTGATAGVGRGISQELAQHGARVFITGRSAPDWTRLDEHTTAIRCDHRDDKQVDAVFDRIQQEAGTIDILVNSVWGSYECMMEDGAFTWAKPFCKAATDKMTADMAIELKPYGVTVVSLYPGMVRTGKVLAASQWLDRSNSESPDFIGRAVVALAADDDALRHTGNVLVAAALAQEYGFTDVDGRRPRPLTIADV